MPVHLLHAHRRHQCHPQPPTIARRDARLNQVFDPPIGEIEVGRINQSQKFFSQGIRPRSCRADRTAVYPGRTRENDLHDLKPFACGRR